ncbi:MAG TPA: trigger factor [Candidatus Kapabacteria bacterium]|nr:trigger factor [Candidatus Kapabacteria bacterium]
METRIETLSQCEKEIFFTLDRSELNPYYEKAYRDAQKNLKVQGFRPGKVPPQILKQRFGKSIERDAADGIINDVFNKFLKDYDMGYYGQPHLHQFEHTDEFLKFSLHIQVEPEFELAEYRDLVVDEPVHQVTQEEIDTKFEELLASNGTNEVAETVSDYYHIVGVNIFELDENGNRPEGKEAIKEFLYLNQQGIFPQIKESLLNTKGGDIVKVDLPEYNGIPAKTIELEVLEIQKLILAEATEEFLQKFSNDRFTNVDDFKEDLGFQLQEEWDKISKRELENNLVNRLLETQPQFDIPKFLVQVIADNLLKEDLHKHKLEDNEQNRKKLYNNSYTERAEKIARWQIILDKIIKKENLKIEDYDIDSEVSKFAEQYKIDKEIIKAKLLEDKDFINSLLVKKAMDFLLDFTVTNEVQFSGDLNYNFDSYEEDEDLDDEFDEEFEEADLDEEHGDEFEDDYDEDEEEYEEADFDEFDDEDEEEEEEEDK